MQSFLGTNKEFAEFTEKQMYQSHLLNQKRYSGTGVFLWILQKLIKNLFFIEYLQVTVLKEYTSSIENYI